MRQSIIAQGLLSAVENNNLIPYESYIKMRNALKMY
jgi:hypothetical protein